MQARLGFSAAVVAVEGVIVRTKEKKIRFASNHQLLCKKQDHCRYSCHYAMRLGNTKQGRVWPAMCKKIPKSRNGSENFPMIRKVPNGSQNSGWFGFAK